MTRFLHVLVRKDTLVSHLFLTFLTLKTLKKLVEIFQITFELDA